MKGKKPIAEFAYLAELDKLVGKPSPAKTVEEFLTLDHIEQTLAIRAACKTSEVREEMKKSEDPKKRQENEVFAMQIGKVARMHLIYLCFKLARERIETKPISDAKAKLYLETSLKVFALKQLTIDA